MVPRGLEPQTLRLLAVRSNQLSYGTSGAIKSAEIIWVPERAAKLDVLVQGFGFDRVAELL